MTTQKAEIYLVRHAESEANLLPHLIAGRSSESPLTSRGVEQAQQLGLYMLDNEMVPINVFASPARRTRSTAAHALKQLGLEGMEPVVSTDLLEQSQGEYEGKVREEVYTDEIKAERERLGKNFKLPGAESMNEVGQRVDNWVQRTIEEVASERASEEPIQIYGFTHAGSVANLASRILDWGRYETYQNQVAIPNASISRFVLDKGKLSVDYVGHKTS